jgi:hypothetical protein
MMGDGMEHLSKIGELPKGASRREFTRTTLEGGELPYGVESVKSLGDRRIEIRDPEEHVVLKGGVPVIHDDTPPDGGGTGGDGGGTDPGPTETEPLVAKAVFHRTEFAGERESRGVVVVTKRVDGGHVRFEFGRLAPETGYLLSIGARGNMTLVDDFRTNRDGGAGIDRDTADAHGLQLGVDGVGGLAGKRVEVRDLDENVVLYAEVPAVETVKDTAPVHEEEHAEDPETGADVKVTVDIKPDKGREEVTIVVKDVPRTDTQRTKRAGRRMAELVMDDGAGAATTVARTRVRGRYARVRITTRGGRELPFGVESVRDLSGRAFDVTVGGVRVASGTLPQL